MSQRKRNMHQTRQASSTKLPLPRKGTKYVARASSHLQNAVPVLIAVRDMLKLAHTAHEVKHLIKQKMLKLNGRLVRDMHESIKLFNQFEADKTYRLSLLSTGRFVFKELTKPEDFLHKVIGKKTVKKGRTQLNLHDGTNLITKEKIAIGDSLYLNAKGKITSHIPLEKGREVFITAGKHLGTIGKIRERNNNRVNVELQGGRTATLEKRVLFVLT